MSKYAAKGEPRFNSATGILKFCVNGLHQTDPASSDPGCWRSWFWFLGNCIPALWKTTVFLFIFIHLCITRWKPTSLWQSRWWQQPRWSSTRPYARSLCLQSTLATAFPKSSPTEPCAFCLNILCHQRRSKKTFIESSHQNISNLLYQFTRKKLW